MKSVLIFYLANKTAINQSLLKSKIVKVGLTIDEIMVATSVRGLIRIFEKNLKHSDLVFIIGGVNVRWEINILNLMSYFLSFPAMKKEDMIKNSVTLADDAFFIEGRKQNFIVLSNDLDCNACDKVLSYLVDNLKLKKTNEVDEIQNKKEWLREDFDEPALEKPHLDEIYIDDIKISNKHNINVCFKVFTLIISFIISALLSITISSLF